MSLKDTVGVKNPYRYRGYRYDSQTGLYYLNSRYYNPEWGRFLNGDVLIATSQGLLSSNLFVYCLNNPASNKDDNGFLCSSVTDGCSGKSKNTVVEVIMAVVKSFEFQAGVGTGIGAEASAQVGVVSVSASGLAKVDAVSYVGAQGKNDLGMDFAASLGFGIGPVSIGPELGKFHSFFNKSKKCRCNFLRDPILGEIYNCNDSIIKEPNYDNKLSFGGSAYFIFGASFNAGFNISYLNNELKNIFGGY